MLIITSTKKLKKALSRDPQKEIYPDHKLNLNYCYIITNAKWI